jgi:Na+/H+ antiporter NhaD/arsenite permease-like protein
MTEKSPLREATWLIGLSFDILIMAFIGYFLSQRFGFSPFLGALIGAVIGTFLMWIGVLRMGKILRRRRVR